MKSVSKISFYLFHPIWIPFIGVLLFFAISPRAFSVPFMKAQLLAVSTFSIGIPILILALILNFRLSESTELKEQKGKRIFLITAALLLIILDKFILGRTTLEVYFFLLALGISYGLLVAFSLFGKALSMHTTAFSALTCFVVSLSYLYGINLSYLIALLIFILGVCMMQRMESVNYKLSEIGLAVLIGILPQIPFLWISLKHFGLQ